MLRIYGPRAGLIAFAVVLVGGGVRVDPAVTVSTMPAQAPRVSGAAPDFNGDGFADLAIGGNTYRPGANLPTGTISVLYGSASGLSVTGNALISADDFPGRQLENFGATLATGDFDGDAYADLAVGILPGGEDPQPHTGEVRVIYGSAAGLSITRSQVWSPNSPGVPGASESDDAFSEELTVGNFGKGNQDDLAVGAGGWSDGRGRVTILYGGAGGLSATDSQAWSQASPGVPGRAGAGENFGGALAAGNFTGGRYDDLAVGVPRDGAAQGEDGPGSVNILRGSASGLTSQEAQLWNQATPGVKGQALPGEGFGLTLSAGHFAGRAAADLAVGVMGDTAAGKFGGAVNVLYGSPAGLTAAGNQIFARRTPGLAKANKLDSFLGSTLAAGDFGRNDHRRTYDDLVLFAYNDFTRGGSVDSRGVLEVLYGSDSGLSTRHSQSWDWRTPGVKGRGATGENGDSYGNSTAAADFGRTSGGPYDDIAAADGLINGADDNHYGAVSVLYGTSDGLTARSSQLWTAQSLSRTEPRFFGVSIQDQSSWWSD